MTDFRTSTLSASALTVVTQIVDADILITTPFHPGYATREVIAKAKNLKLAVCVFAFRRSDPALRQMQHRWRWL